MTELSTIKIEVTKMLLALIPAGFFIWTDQMQNFSILLLLLVALDTMTGWIKSTSLFKGGFSSNSMFNFKKMILYAIALMLFYLLSHIPGLEGSFIYVTWWLSLREAWSVMENLSDCGLEFPQRIVEKVRGSLIKTESK